MKDFIKELENLGQGIWEDIKDIAEIEVENFIQDNFDNEGFHDKSLKKWAAVKDIKKKGKILTGTGHMAKTIEVKTFGDVIQVTSPTKYMKIHNEGGKAGRNGSAIIPKREIIGKSKKLNDTIQREVSEFLTNRLKRF